MKLIAASLTLLIGINLTYQAGAFAKFAIRQTRQVPINRLLKNLELQRADAVSSTDKAMVDFRIGRLHAMAYAQKVEDGPADAQVTPGSRYELPEFGQRPDHVQFQVVESKDKNKQSSAGEHLKLAISSLQKAVKTDPSLLSAKLGLSWCIEQTGDKIKARQLYREIFSTAYCDEKTSKGGMYNWSISLETATYLRPLLDPVKDKHELEVLSSKVADIEKLPRYITPIMIPLSSASKLSELTQKKEVSFDLDGFGKRRYSRWISPKAAWLVFDSEHNGKIDSGLKLVGQSSFWIFWKNGYEVLKGLDDNRDGKLTGSELDGLALWADKNCNGECEAGEVQALAKYGISAIKTGCSKHSSGLLFNPNGVEFNNKISSASYDLVLNTAAPSPSPAHPPALLSPQGARSTHSP